MAFLNKDPKSAASSSEMPVQYLSSHTSVQDLCQYSMETRVKPEYRDAEIDMFVDADALGCPLAATHPHFPMSETQGLRQPLNWHRIVI